MTKEDVLQKANDYCTEKAYTTETLTDDFKEKFSEFFAKRYPDVEPDDEDAIAALKFDLDTAFSATSKGLTSKQKAFEEKENEYKNQIAELTRKLGKNKDKDDEPKIPKELQEQLDELKEFKNAEAKKNKFKSIIDIAKESIREDLHKSFETYAKSFNVELEKEDKEQAKTLVAQFQEIFQDSIGDIKPLAPKQIQKLDEEFLASIPKVKVK